MKRFIIFSCFALLILVGCDMDLGMDSWDWGDWGGSYDPWNPDPNAVSYVSITLSDNTVHYTAGDTAQVTGYAVARNYNGQGVSGATLQFCASDSAASFVWYNADLRNTTNADGWVNFTLRCPDCSGDHEVRVTNYGGSGHASVVFLPEDRRPTYLSAYAFPDTLRQDGILPDTVTFGVIVTDTAHHLLPGVAVRCSSVLWNHAGCYQHRSQTDSAGNASDNLVYRYSWSSPYRLCYSFFVGGLRDTACVYIMPYDSTKGG